MKKILFEVLCDEIPAKLQKSTIDQFLIKFKEKDLEILDDHYFYGPRRWTFYCEWESDKSKDEEKFERGPKTSAPEIAVQKFCEKFNITSKKLEKYLSNGAEYYCYKKNEKISEKEFLEKTITEILNSITFPKTMDWSGNNGIKWIRPIRNILAIYDNGNKIENLEIEFAGIKSNNFTFGHQILTNNKAIVIRDLSLKNYISVLKKEFVIVDHNERKKIILDGCKNYHYNVNELTEKHSDLFEELISIAEYPVVMKCEIKNEYLSIPPEIIEYTMIKNQRYIPFLPNFLVVIDHNNPNEKMKSGYERVLNARLDDAKFFWDSVLEKDIDNLIKLLKTTQSEYNPDLSVYEFNKILAERMANIFVSKNTKFTHHILNLISCDLGTELISEFPALRGIIADYYLRKFYETEYSKINDSQYLGLSIAYYFYWRESELYLRYANVYGYNGEDIALITEKYIMKLEYYLVEKDENPTGSKDPFALFRCGENAINLNPHGFDISGYNLKIKRFLKKCFGNILKCKEEYTGNPIAYKIIDLLTEDNEYYLHFIMEENQINEYLQICKANEYIIAYKRLSGLYHKFKDIETPDTQDTDIENIQRKRPEPNDKIPDIQLELKLKEVAKDINDMLDNLRIEGATEAMKVNNMTKIKNLYFKNNNLAPMEALLKIATSSYN